MNTTHPIADGSLVRLTRELTDDERSWVTLGHGTEWTVDEYVPALQAPADDEIDVAFYEATDAHGCSVTVPADAVEVVKTAAQMAARTVPTVTELTAELGITNGWSNRFDIDEWHRSGDEIECYATTSDGLRFAFTIKITGAWKTDL